MLRPRKPGRKQRKPTAEDNSDAAVVPEETKEPTIVEITNENWEQYFEIVPVHAAYPYVIAGSEDEERIANYNGFELALKDEGKVNIPTGAEVTATVSFQYDGEMLGADDNKHPSDSMWYPARFFAEDGPIEFERKASINRAQYALYVRNQAIKNSTAEVQAKEQQEDGFDYTTSEVQTVERQP